MRHLYNDPVQQQKQLTVFIDFFLNCPETKSNSRSFDRKFLIDIFSSNTDEKSFLQLLLMMATMGYGKSVLPSSPSFTENIPKFHMDWSSTIRFKIHVVDLGFGPLRLRRQP